MLAAQDNFLTALEQDNVPLAEDILNDVKDAGFYEEAIRMMEKVREYRKQSLV